MTIDQIKYKLLHDRAYLAAAVIDNNPVAVAAKMYSAGLPIGSSQEDLAQIITLYNTGKGDLADKVLNVQWREGEGNPAIEEALLSIQNDVTANNTTRQAGVGQAILTGVVGFISGFTSVVNANNTAQNQAQVPVVTPQPESTNWGKIILFAFIIIVLIVIAVLVYRRMNKA